MSDPDEKKLNKESPFSLTLSVIQNELSMHLHDKNTMNMYHASFTPKQLEECGFNNKQVTNLEGICKFIATAKAGHNNLKFSISIDHQNNNDDGDGFGVIKISKEDDFFGEMNFIMRLKQTEREQSDTNKDHIYHLKEQNITLKQQLNELQRGLEKNKMETEQLKKSLGDKLKKMESAFTEKLKILKDELTESKEEDAIYEELPIGSIILWSGSRSNIPKKWALCDGNNGSPDLRNKFIVGAGGQFGVKQKGGTANHAHNINVNGHRLTTQQIPSHQHDFYNCMWVYDSDNNNRSICNKGNNWLNNIASGNGNERTKPSGGGAAHSHTASAASVQHLPPYIALCFIIKIK
eukprot:497464_1